MMVESASLDEYSSPSMHHASAMTDAYSDDNNGEDGEYEDS